MGPLTVVTQLRQMLQMIMLNTLVRAREQFSRFGHGLR